MGDLGLEITTAAAEGRKAAPLALAFVREISRGDLALLASVPKAAGQAVIKKLTERHHALARALAGGMRPTEAAISIGYDVSRVSVLKSCPAFADLVEFYREQVSAEYVGFHSRMASLGHDAAATIQDRLEDDPDDFTNDELLKLATSMADRTGYGPSRTEKVDVNVNLGERLQSARLRAKEAAMAQIIDVTPGVGAE